jgi:hypothetical protein
MSAVATPSRGSIVLDESLTYHKLARSGGFGQRTEELQPSCEYDGFNYKSAERQHGLLSAIHCAFAEHLELVLTPDDFWTCVVQGICEHVSRSPEKHRSKLVKHAEGKVKVKIVRNDLVMGGTSKEQWMSLVHDLTAGTREHTLEDSITSRMQQSFGATTTDLHRLVYAGAVLSTLQHYISFECMSMCGIPKVTLEGSPSDWLSLEARFHELKLSEFDEELKPWNDRVSAIFKQLAAIRVRMEDGNTNSEDVAFFKNIYKYKTQSGGSSVTGWFAHMFPHVSNSHLDSDTPSVKTEYFPSGHIVVPWEWHYLVGGPKHGVYNMLTCVGFDAPLVDYNTKTSRTRMAFSVSHEEKPEAKAKVQPVVVVQQKPPIVFTKDEEAMAKALRLYEKSMVMYNFYLEMNAAHMAAYKALNEAERAAVLRQIRHLQIAATLD